MIFHNNPLMNRTVDVTNTSDACVRMHSIGQWLDEHEIDRCHFLKRDCEGPEFDIK